MGSIAVMQPYFFPYIGYWQLICAVDRFIIYSDFNFIKKGWINRNRILIQGAPAYITAPLVQRSSFKRIADLSLLPTPGWRDKMVRKIAITYGKAPYFSDVFPLIEQLIRHETNHLANYLTHQLQMLATFMGIKTEIVAASPYPPDDQLSRQGRIIDLCQRQNANTYVNLKGGRNLYDQAIFNRSALNLRFIFMRTIPYPQRAVSFIPSLSIIDALMMVGPIGIQAHLMAFELHE